MKKELITETKKGMARKRTAGRNKSLLRLLNSPSFFFIQHDIINRPLITITMTEFKTENS